MMLYLLSLVGAVFLGVMAVLLIWEKEYFYGCLNTGFIIFLVVLYFMIRTGKRIRLYSIVSILFLQFLFLFLFHSGAGDGMAFIWFYLIPLVALFLLGPETGTVISILLISLSIIINIFSEAIPVFGNVHYDKMVRIVLSYLAVLFFALIFESTRKSTQKKLEKSVAELNELAIRDTLTGLYNRRYMNEIILRIMDQLKRSGFTFAFIMADLDYFKSYNDEYGHQAGDELLKAFSKSLVSCVKRKTDFVFRYGGEEFALILSSTSKETVEDISDRIIEAAEKLPYIHEKSPFGRITVSLGAVYCDTVDDTDFQEIIRRADVLLYKAKEAGRNQYLVGEI